MSTDTVAFKGELSEMPKILKALKKNTESPVICGNALKALAQIFEKSCKNTINNNIYLNY